MSQLMLYFFHFCQRTNVLFTINNTRVVFFEPNSLCILKSRIFKTFLLQGSLLKPGAYFECLQTNYVHCMDGFGLIFHYRNDQCLCHLTLQTTNKFWLGFYSRMRPWKYQSLTSSINGISIVQWLTNILKYALHDEVHRNFIPSFLSNSPDPKCISIT
jgi:hypothetical protein